MMKIILGEILAIYIVEQSTDLDIYYTLHCAML